jgi:hypothetical protein
MQYIILEGSGSALPEPVRRFEARCWLRQSYVYHVVGRGVLQSNVL